MSQATSESAERFFDAPERFLEGLPADVVAELVRRDGLSGLEEKALRKAQAREAGE